MITLTVSHGAHPGHSYSFAERDRVILGCAPDANIRVDEDELISLHQLLFEINPPNVLVTSLGGEVVLNGTRDKLQNTALAGGDVVEIGRTRITVSIAEPDIAAATGPPSRAGIELDTLLGAPPAPASRSVRCQRCGVRSPSQARGDLWYCPDCSQILADDPVVPTGYRVVRKLGQGNMGAVYLAVHDAHGECALKVVLPKAAITEANMKRFLREAHVQLALKHPRIVRAFAVEEPAPGVFCLAMEYVRGVSGDRLLEREPAGLAPGLAGAIVAQLLEGLEYAHSWGIVHRDVKESNVILREGAGTPQALLADFGLAKSYETAGASGVTHSGAVGGTIAYMPPEQIVDFRGVRPSADLYAAGATLYRLLTGTWPHAFQDGVNPLITILETEPVPISSRRADIPAALAEVVDRATRWDPAERYVDAAEMRLAILTALDPEAT